MKIAILGAGFTGLAAGLKLLDLGHQVIILEKESDVGGLAAGFSQPGWNWTLEKSYHHWFTNDDSVLNLAKRVNFPVLIKRPQTEVFYNGTISPFDSPLALLQFPHFSLIEKIRFGFWTFYLKIKSDHQDFDSKLAVDWVKKYYGESAYKIIWEPLFKGKFGDFKDRLSLTWFWARIKKRTPSLAYPEGGYKKFAEHLAHAVEKNGGQILLNTEIKELKSEAGIVTVKTASKSFKVDRVLVTLPSPIFTKITPQLPEKYTTRINSIPHLHALNLILVLKKPFLKDQYWLNITEPGFPFLVLAEHTNFMDPKNYGGQHILFIGNYLPQNHPYLKLTAAQLLKKFDPFLKRINPNYQKNLIATHLTFGPFAQPVVEVDYPKKIPTLKTPLKNIYLANMDMVYPWDRGTNYAVEMGENSANEISKS